MQFALSKARILSGVSVLLYLVCTNGIAQSSQQGNTDDSDISIEEIVVYGVRANLELALDRKRNASQFIDSISSEGIGRLPDLNLGESLARIPGVQISRSAERREARISLRGLPGAFQQTTLNGFYIASPQQTGFSYGRLRSEVFAGADTIKSQTAADASGGLAGTVNLRTGDPLSAGNSIDVSTDVYYEGLTEKVVPGFAISASRQLIENRLAIRAALGYKENDFRDDSFRVVSYDQPVGGDTLDTSDDLYTPREARLAIYGFEGENLSSTLDVEFRATDRLSLKFTGFFNNDDSLNLTHQNRFSVRGDSTVTLLGSPTDAGALGQTHTNIRIENPRIFTDTRSRFLEETISAYTGQLTWTNDTYEVGAAIHSTKGSRDESRPGFQVRLEPTSAGNGAIVELDIGDGSSSPATVSVTSNISPAMLIDLSQPFSPTPNAITRAVNNPNQRLRLGFNNVFEEDEELSFHLDVARNFESGPFNRVEIGAVYRDKKQAQQRTLTTAFGAQLDKLNNDLIGPFSGGDAFLGGAASYWNPANYGVTDLLAAMDLLTPVDLSGDVNGDYFLDSFGYANVIDASGVANTYKNDLEILGAYITADFAYDFSDSISARGNIGARYEETERLTLASSNFVPTPFEYDNLTPFLNVITDIGEDLLFRFSFSDTMRRPEADQFSVLRSIVVGSGGNNITIDLGAADLKPFLSRNYDAALEWYNRTGSAISLSIFRKEVRDFGAENNPCPLDGGGFGFGPFQIVADTCLTIDGVPAMGFQTEVLPGAIVTINQVANQDEFTLQGYEFSIQQNLDFLPAPWNGFGGQFNYTYVDFDTTSDFELSELSQDTYNLIVFYETSRFGVRAALNNRGRYSLAGGGSGTGSQRFVNPRFQVDLSVRYEIFERAILSFEAFNITDEQLFEYQGVEARPRSFAVTGQTYSLGLRYSF